MISDSAAAAFERVRSDVGDPPTRERDWETIYRAVWPILIARASKRGLGGFAADAVQSALLSVLSAPQRVAEFASLDDFIAYCSRASTNRAIDAIRRTLRLDPIEAVPEPAAQPEEDPILLYMPNNLSSDDSQLARLFYLEGQTYSEIAVALNLSERQIKTRMYMLQRKLYDLSQKTP